MAEKKLLSLCIITKNDEKHLLNCLQNMSGVVDEIIIVDIGSRDLTIDIAKQAGANIYQMKWENNYSEAKNFCLDKAKGRWILFLQANETISTEQLEEIRYFLDDPNVEGYLLHIDYCLQDYRISSPVQSLRLIRNRKEYRYKYKVFERIPDEFLSNIKDIGIRIVQQGDCGLSGEVDLVRLLLEEDLKEYPEDSYLQYMYGIELLNQQRYEESLVYLQKACENVNFDYLFAPHLYKCLSWAFISLQRYAEALDILNDAIKIFPFYTDFLVLRGEVRKQFQQYEEAIQDLERGLSIRQQPSSMVPVSDVNISIILEILAEIHEQVFNYNQALVYYQQSYNLNNNNQKLLYKIGELVERVDSPKVLENILEVAIEQNNLQQLIIIMDILFEQQQYTQVLAHIEYLESLIGKGEQTESIKFFCYTMLGETKKADIHFSFIDKKSSFYNHVLLQRIESYWFNNQWQEARQLLDEIDQIESIEISIKDLYHILNQLLTQKELFNISLGEQEYEIVSTLLERFLWFGQMDKAQLILPLLLQAEKEDKYIELAEIWAEVNDYQTIEKIFLCISNKQKQLEFKQKIVQKLLHDEHIETAQKLINLGDLQPLGALEYVFWSKYFIKRLEEWIEKVRRWNTSVIVSETPVLQKPTKPNKVLVQFYNSLGLSESNVNKNASDLSDTGMTNARIHEEIGDFYIKAEKKKEAISAYLRALQWDPLDDIVQEKIRDIFYECSSEFYVFLEQEYWILEGIWFQHKQEFINYILGIIHFKSQEFEKALEYFRKIKEDENSYTVVLAYIVSSLWLMGMEEEAERCLKKQSETSDVVLLFYHICKNYALDRLDQGYKQYPYSELIMLEKQRLDDIRY